MCSEACKDPALTLFPSNQRKPSHTPLFFLCQQDCSNLCNLQNVCYHHNKPYIPRCYLQPDNHSPAGLVPDMSSLGTSVLWKPHRNVIQGFFDNGTNHLILEEDIKWCVACWSMKKMLKPSGAGGPSLAGYKGIAITVNNQVGCVQRGCW